MASAPFHFKDFSIDQPGAVHKVGTDGVLLGAWADISRAASILDIGTGTGLIALMLAQRSNPDTPVTALEILPESAACARSNFENSPWQHRLTIVETALQDFYPQNRYDLVVSNPPFFSERTLSPHYEKNMARHTDAMPLRVLADGLSRLVSEQGICCLIMPVKEARMLCELAASNGLFCTEEIQVHGREGKPAERLMIRLERNAGSFSKSMLHVYDKQGSYSEGFKRLTSGFYLAH